MADDVRFTRLADGREVAYRVLSDTERPVIVHIQETTFPMEMLDEVETRFSDRHLEAR